jgi:hypothetical protein
MLPTLAPAAPARQGALANPEMLGMVIRDPWYEGTFPGQPDVPNRAAQERMGAMLNQTGVRWVRLEFHIDCGIVCDEAFITTQVARNDFFINEVAPRYNLKVLGLLSFGLIRWSDPREVLTTTVRVDPLYGGGVNDYMKAWLDRARLIAARYEGRVSAYEVLNEQNRLPPSGDAIIASVAARLHTKFYRMFKQEDAKAPGQAWREMVPIIIGGLHPGGTGTFNQPGFVSDIDYIKLLYASDGFQSFKNDSKNKGRYPLDGIGYHPYPEEIRRSRRGVVDQEVLPRMNLVRAAINSFYTATTELEDTPPQFWITEIGYNAAYRTQTEAGQAEFMRDVYTHMAARGDVTNVFWFKYEDFPPAVGPNAQKWGIVRIPFTESNSCPGGACYDPTGQPAEVRATYLVYRELAGLPVYHTQLPLAVK